MSSASTNKDAIKPRVSEDETKCEKVSDIVDAAHLKSLRLPDPLEPSKVARLLYTHSGEAVLVLASNAVHKLWKWQRSDRNPSGKSTASIMPHLWQPSAGAQMTNDLTDVEPSEESVTTGCIALTKNDFYVISASGGKVYLFNMMTFEVMATCLAPPPAATYLAIYPQDNNIMAIGMEDSSIEIFNVRANENMIKLKGHQKRITGLAFSQTLNVLVSSGADAQLCVWDMDDGEKIRAKPIQAPPGHQSPLVGETKVQFHRGQIHLLVVHESQIAEYDCLSLDCLRSWYPRESLSAPISSASYSCDGLLVFTGFCDGAVGVFDVDSFRLRCRIGPSAYISRRGNAFPVVIAAHPSETNQMALGMSDGSVHVIEPSDADSKWGNDAPQKNWGLSRSWRGRPIFIGKKKSQN